MLIPLKVDVPTFRAPWANYALIAVIACVSIVAFGNEELLCKLSGIGVELDEAATAATHHLTFKAAFAHDAMPRPVLAVTSAFLHGGWIHMLGNLWFLFVFGSAVNYKFGQWQYLALFLLAAFAGGMAHYAISGGPYVGASGAINGIVGAFLVFFPRNDVKMAWIWGVWGNTFTISSYWVILMWFGWDVLSLVLHSGGDTALGAHIGGFLSGFAVAMVCACTGLLKPTSDEQTLLTVFSGSGQRKSKYY